MYALAAADPFTNRGDLPRRVARFAGLALRERAAVLRDALRRRFVARIPFPAALPTIICPAAVC